VRAFVAAWPDEPARQRLAALALGHPKNLRPVSYTHLDVYKRQVVNHAEDRCIIVDASLIPLLAAIKDDLKTVETIIVVGEGETSALGETLSYERLLGAEEPGFDWPDLDERSAAAMCYTCLLYTSRCV